MGHERAVSIFDINVVMNAVAGNSSFRGSFCFSLDQFAVFVFDVRDADACAFSHGCSARGCFAFPGSFRVFRRIESTSALVFLVACSRRSAARPTPQVCFHENDGKPFRLCSFTRSSRQEKQQCSRRSYAMKNAFGKLRNFVLCALPSHSGPKLCDVGIGARAAIGRRAI